MNKAETVEKESIWADGGLTIAKAVEFSGIGRTQLYALMTGGKIPYKKQGDRRLIPRRALVSYLESLSE